MSKTRQRKEQAYYEGLKDGRRGLPPRWKKHPFLKFYKRGHRQGTVEREDVQIVSYDDL